MTETGVLRVGNLTILNPITLIPIIGIGVKPIVIGVKPTIRVSISIRIDIRVSIGIRISIRVSINIGIGIGVSVSIPLVKSIAIGSRSRSSCSTLLLHHTKPILNLIIVRALQTIMSLNIGSHTIRRQLLTKTLQSNEIVIHTLITSILHNVQTIIVIVLTHTIRINNKEVFATVTSRKTSVKAIRVRTLPV